MKGPVEEWQPMADERRPDGIVEQCSDRLVCAVALEQEDDLGLGQKDHVSLEGLLEIPGIESRMFGEQRLRSLTSVGSQAGNKNEALHGSKPTLRPDSEFTGPHSTR